MNPKFLEKLKNTDSPEHGALLTHVKGLIEISREAMATNYTVWDENQRIFESKRQIDKEDRNTIAKGGVKKMIVPMTFSQIMSFVAYCVMSVTQNRRFFELEPTGREDDVLAEPMELILERDLRRNKWSSFLVQFFLDVGRFSLGAAEVCYEEMTRMVKVKQDVEQQEGFGQTSKATQESWQEVPVFVGNKVYPISPYRFYPDTRLPLTEYQRGEFCGSEDMFSLSGLQSMGDDLFNLDKIPKMSVDDYRTRIKKSRIDLGPINENNPNLGGFGANMGDKSSDNKVKSGPVVVTKNCFDLNPSQWHKDRPNFEPMGEEDFLVRYLCWYANDGTIVRFEEAYYLHFQFPYICGQYIVDQHNVVNQSLADVCDQLTSLITWKINTHMASQRNSVESRWAVDPSGVRVETLESGSPYIYLKKNLAIAGGVDRYIKQFKTDDVTAGVFNDVAAIKDLLESATGNSAQMQGQYSSGRRSATQDRVVAQGASARGKTTLGGIWDNAFEPLGKQLIVNNRQEMDFETFSRILGDRDWPLNKETGVPYTTQEIYTLFKSDPVSLAASEDFFVFDATNPSEKAFLAQSMQELLMTMLTNPIVAQVMGFGPEQIRELFNQIYLLRGVTPARLPAPTALATSGAAQPAPPVVLPPPNAGATSGGA